LSITQPETQQEFKPPCNDNLDGPTHGLCSGERPFHVNLVDVLSIPVATPAGEYGNPPAPSFPPVASQFYIAPSFALIVVASEAAADAFPAPMLHRLRKVVLMRQLLRP